MSFRLTAILCNYNHGPYIHRAIEAMLSQSRPPDELIIVDDGSTDASVSVIEPWATRDSRVRFLRNERNLGLLPSFAGALEAATGDYIYGGAADDYVLPGFFEALMSCLERHPHIPVASGKIITAQPDGQRVRIDEYSRFTTEVCLTPSEYLRDCLLAEPPTHSLSGATIYRRTALQAIGGWRVELGSWADTFAIRVLGLTQGFCYVPHDSLVWIVHSSGLSQTTWRRPERALKQMRLAANLMRSPEFVSVFPAEYVRQWEEGMLEAIARQRLQPAVDGYQAVQRTFRKVAQETFGPQRWVLGLLRRLMTGCYLMAFYFQQRAVRQSLHKLEQPVAESENQ